MSDEGTGPRHLINEPHAGMAAILAAHPKIDDILAKQKASEAVLTELPFYRNGELCQWKLYCLAYGGARAVARAARNAGLISESEVSKLATRLDNGNKVSKGTDKSIRKSDILIAIDDKVTAILATKATRAFAAKVNFASKKIALDLPYPPIIPILLAYPKVSSNPNAIEILKKMPFAYQWSIYCEAYGGAKKIANAAGVAGLISKDEVNKLGDRLQNIWRQNTAPYESDIAIAIKLARPIIINVICQGRSLNLSCRLNPKLDEKLGPPKILPTRRLYKHTAITALQIIYDVPPHPISGPGRPAGASSIGLAFQVSPAYIHPDSAVLGVFVREQSWGRAIIPPALTNTRMKHERYLSPRKKDRS